jgi:hypothetical protein
MTHLSGRIDTAAATIASEMRDSDRKKLWALAGGRCSRCKLPHSEVRLEEAHIIGPRADSPRSDPRVSPAELDAYENRILLCPNCHTIVDDKANIEGWPVERLRQLKAQHEEDIRQSSGTDVTELGGDVMVRAVDGDDVAGARIKKPTRIKPGTSIAVEASNVRRVTGVEIGGEE